MVLVQRLLLVAATGLAFAACATSRGTTAPPSIAQPSERPSTDEPAPQEPKPRAAAPAPEETVPSTFEAPGFLMVFASSGDTAESLAARHLGDGDRAWTIEEYAGARTFSGGEMVVIPTRDWNPAGVHPDGYQLVPILVYHNLGQERKGQLLIAARTFEEQMRYLHAEGYRTVTISELLAFAEGRRQLPRKSVLIAFDDGHRSFLTYAKPVLKELGFRATLFVYTDFVGAGANALSWDDLKRLIAEGFDVQAHSKSHSDLRRKPGESDADYAKRLRAELETPQTLFRRHLGRPSETIAYPYGETNDQVARQLADYGYAAGFTVRRQANPAFALPVRLSRAQIYSDMTLPTFARNLTVFHREPLETVLGVDRPEATSVATTNRVSLRARFAAPHLERAGWFERHGDLRRALDARMIALAIDPVDEAGKVTVTRLEGRIERQVTGLVEEGRRLLAAGLHLQARKRFLAALVLDPANRTAFTALQKDVREVASLVHVVRAGETLTSLAELYYGESVRAEVIAEANGLRLNARVVSGQKLQIPEIPGVNFVPR